MALMERIPERNIQIFYSLIVHYARDTRVVLVFRSHHLVCAKTFERITRD